MYTVPLPDPLYIEAQRAAAASGVSLESFIVDAVQLHLNDEPEEKRSLTLSDEQAKIIELGRADIKAGKGLTMEQVEKKLAAKKAAWLQANQR